MMRRVFIFFALCGVAFEALAGVGAFAGVEVAPGTVCAGVGAAAAAASPLPGLADGFSDPSRDCRPNPSANNSAQPAVEFDAATHDFGTISSEGGKVSHEFIFTNTGDAPLLILKAEVSCTCTKIDYPRGPVASGGKGTITVTYNPKKQFGTFHKAINLRVNTPAGTAVIFIKGAVTGR